MSIYHNNLGEAPIFFPIPGGMDSKKTITVRGIGTDGFAINLQTAADEDCDIAFHFNPRQSEECVVRNTCVDGGWQEEERDADFFPFEDGKPYVVQIYTASSYFRVSVDGKFFCQYNHRLDKKTIQAVALKEGIFTDIEIDDKLKTEYISGTDGPVCCGTSFRIRGFPNADCNRFDINLHPSKELSGDHILHFCPRFEEERVVRNAKLDGEWGDEEDEGGLPFRPEEYFTVDMYCMDEEYRFFVNGDFFCSMAYRCPSDQACFISVTGDVQVLNVDSFTNMAPEFVAPLGAELKVGDMFAFRGMVFDGADRFEFNLYASEDRSGDCVVHINPRFGQEAVIMNAKQGGDWQGEEEAAMPAMFQPGQPFFCYLAVTESGFQLLNERSHVLCEFAHRAALSDVTHFGAEGDATFSLARFMPALPEPAMLSIPGSVRHGRWVSTLLRVKDDANRFEINFQCGGDYHPNCTIAFHFNPRFDEETTVRNSAVDGDWSEEEREGDFPFSPGKVYRIEFFFGKEEIQTFVNGMRYIHFPHRFDSKTIDHVEFEADAAVAYVGYH